MQSLGFTSVPPLLKYVRHAEQLGMAIEPALAAAGLQAQQLSDNSLRLPGETHERLLDYFCEHSGDPLFGLNAANFVLPNSWSVLGYITMNDANEKALQKSRHAVRDKKKVATVLGFGPRFLHSTGQAYKGGPNSGVFLQITCDDAVDLPVPDQKYTFGVVKAAQARGDFAVLAERGRRALRVHLSKNVGKDLAKLGSALQQALK